MVMVGRRRELAVIERLLERAAAGTGGLLVISGAPGVGTTTLLAAAAELARQRGLPVVRGPASGDQKVPALVVIDDADAETVKRIAAQTHSVTVVATVRAPLGLGQELHLGGLSEADLGDLLGDLPATTVHAVWLASGGRPGPALALVDSLADLDPSATVEEVFVHVALTAPSRTAFLDPDTDVLRLLETTTDRSLTARDRALVLARLARELLGDPSAGARRRDLVDEALTLARTDGDPGTIAAVLDSRLHALWDPRGADERLSTAGEIVRHARQAGAGDLERQGLFWSFIAHAELGDLPAAETALMRYHQAATLAGDEEAAVVVLARQAMLATVRGRFATAAALVDEVALRGRRAGMNDTDRLVASIQGQLALLRGEVEDRAGHLLALARQMPGHFYEATAARLLLEVGQDVEAALELQRLRPAVLAGSGPRWLAAAADLALVASRVGEPEDARALFDALRPYRGRLVVWGGANTITGPVDDYLGRLALRLGRVDEARSLLDDAVALEERIGALPWLVHTLLARARVVGSDEQDAERARTIARQLGMRLARAPGEEWQLTRDGEDWTLDTGTETARLRDRRGIHYLRTLLSAPGQEIPALDVVAGGAGLQAPDEMPVLDDDARAAYRRRLSQLDAHLDDADRRGDAEQASATEAERAALLAELARATGLGGRPRGVTGESERARVNATKALWSTVAQIETAAPRAGAHLRSSLRTGRMLRYQPAPGGPDRWRV